MTNMHAAMEGDGLPANMAAEDPSRWLARLTGMLDEQCALCVQLETLSRRQSGAVAGGNTDALLGVLGERQRIVDRVSQINGLLEPFRRQKDALLGRLNAAQRDGVVQRVGKIAALVESVRARDDADRVTLEKQRAGVGEELTALARGRGAVAAYGAGAGVGGAGGATGTYRAQYQDRKG